MSIGKDFFDSLDQALDAEAAGQQEQYDIEQEERDAETWEPGEGETFKGIFLKVIYVETKWGIKPLGVCRELPSGVTKKVWFSSSVIRDRLESYKPGPGTPIGIRYEGKRPTQDGTNEFHMYTVVMPEGRTQEQVNAGLELWASAQATPRMKRSEAQREAQTANQDDLAPF